ncbi:RND family efflux transporter MFP subunit [Oxalobacteraceae bacterium GrIS 2.11]
MSTINKISTLALCSTSLLILAGCGSHTQDKAVDKVVYVSLAKSDSSQASRILTGVVQARVETDLGFRVDGRVTQRLVDTGQHVEAGQVLARLDPNDYQLASRAAAAQVAATKAELDQARLEQARLERLSPTGAISQSDLERQSAATASATARYDAAQRQSDLAKNKLAYAQLTAPYAGIIKSINTDAGQVVKEGQIIIAMAHDGDREIVVDIPEDLFVAVRQMKPTAALWSQPSISMNLALRELSQSATQQGRVYRARYKIISPDSKTLNAVALGSTAEVTMHAAIETGVRIPVTALIKTTASAGVWVVHKEDGKLVFTPITLVHSDLNFATVTGIAPGTPVVSVGAQKLDAGMKVRAIERHDDVLATTGGQGQ